MRTTPLLLAILLTACTGSSQDPSGQQPVSGAAAPTTPAIARSVTLTVPNPPAADEVTVAFLGFDEKQMAGSWARKGEAPVHHARVNAAKPDTTMTVEAELHTGLTYMVLLDLDGYGVPDDGEITSLPVRVESDAPEVGPFVVDKPFGKAVAGSPSNEPAAVEKPSENVPAVTRTLVVDTKIKPPFLKRGRILVVANEGDGPLIGSTPTFVWMSPKVELDWPVTLEAQVPEEGTVHVLLDLDGGAEASTGDLAASPIVSFTPPAEGEKLEVTLEGPLTDPGEGGE